MRKNANELKLLITQHHPKIIALQETFGPNPSTTQSSLNEYSWTFSNTGNVKHDVAIGIHHSLPFRHIALSTPLPVVAIKIQQPLEATVACIYLPCQPASWTQLESDILNLLSQLPQPVVILGDFNGHHTSWGSTYNNTKGTLLHSIFSTSDLVPLHNRKATRISPITGRGSLIDLCVTSTDIAPEFKVTVSSDNHGSDHLPIFIKHSSNHTAPSHRPRWKYDQADWDLYQTAIHAGLRNFDLDPNSFCSLIIDAASQSIPLTKNHSGKRKVPWWNKEVATAIKERRKYLRLFRRSSKTPDNIFTPLYASLYREANIKARATILKAKEDSWNNFVQEINPSLPCREMWRRVSALTNKKSTTVPILIDRNDNHITDPPDVAEAFAVHFHSSSKTDLYESKFLKHKTNSENIPILFPQPTNHYYNNPFSIEELHWALRKCSGKSAGPDNIGYPLLKYLPPTGHAHLLKIYNNIWRTGNIPASWKESLIVPIPKPFKDKHRTDSYRPISLLNCIGKVMEKIVNRRLIHVLETNQLLSPSHYAFRYGKGTGLYLNDLQSCLTSALDKNHHTDCAIIDLSKAFDRTWRHAILQQLSRWKISGHMVNYISNFLENRLFKVLIGQATSTTKEHENGVPQGAILSPTLFIISLQSLLLSIPTNIKTYIYADDIVLSSTQSTAKLARANLQFAIDKVRQWNRWVGYEISPEKSKIIHFCRDHSHKRGKKITYNNCNIPQVNCARILGVYVDKRLNFLAHCRHLKRTTKSHLNLFKMLGCSKHRASRSTLTIILKNWFLPKLLYGLEMFSLGGPSVTKKLEPLYNTAVRHISGAFRTSPTTSLLCEIGLPPFSHLILNKLVEATSSLVEKNTNPTRLLHRTESLFQTMTNQTLPDTAKLTRLGDRPWTSKPPKIDWTLKNLIRKQNCNNTVPNQLLHSLIERKYNNHKHIYTDGSVLPPAAGCGIFSNTDKCDIRLPDHTSIFSAEAIALSIAIDESTPSNQHSILFTDSSSVLQALEKGCSKHATIQQLEALSTDNITFCWVPGHAGIHGNIQADHLANQGRLQPTNNSMPLARQDLLRWTSNTVLDSWQRAWNSTSSHLRRIKTTVLPWNDTISNKAQRVLTRLRIGHTRITHQHIMERSSPPLCQYCGTTITVQHLLVDCLGYTTERTHFNIDNDITTILQNNRQHQIKLIRFLKATGLYAEI